MIEAAPNAEICVSMPATITHGLIQAVKADPLCNYADKDEMNTRIGWLVCAYDAMVKARTEGRA